MEKSVLITGASTGIGLDAATALANKGFRVFAGVRSAVDQKKLSRISDKITPLILDVTNSTHIKAALEAVSASKPQSFSLVNNAGIAVAGPVEGLSVEDFRRQFEVNFFGLIEITKAFIPLIRRTKGRIVNMSSMSGISSSPFLGAYSASKYAVESLSDSLRWELAPFGVKVSIVEPGPIATPIWQKGMAAGEKKLTASLPADVRTVYEPALAKFTKFIQVAEKTALPVNRVTDAVVTALTAKNPPIRVIVAASSRVNQYRLTKYLPGRLVDKIMSKALFSEKR